MCGKRSFEAQPADGPVEGQTIRLNATASESRSSCRAGFPWWVLWTIWPLIFLAKSAAWLLTPLIGWLNQPLTLSLTPLPFLLIGVGLVLLLLGVARRDRGA